jgi:hypothetical protein
VHRTLTVFRTFGLFCSCLQFSDPKTLKALLEFGSATGVASRCIPPNLVR